MSNGLTFGASYTASKLLEATSYLNNNDAAPERVISDSDRPQRLVLYGIYELPFGQGKTLFNTNRVAKALAGGWQFNWVITYQSMTALAFSGSERIRRSDNNPKNVDRWFDVTQFVPQEPFTLRQTSSRIADLRQQGIRRWDCTVMKKTKLSEGVTMQLQGEFYNMLNTTHLGTPNTTVTNANFGRITGTFLGPREIQVAMRLSF
jgi:hypothetical protein